jgi:hypothetical protein
VLHLSEVGCSWQLYRVRSLQLVTTNIRTMASPAITARVFMVYQGS